MAHSSAEVEYCVMAMSSCEVIWLLALLSDINIAHVGSVKLRCDN